MQYKSGGKHAGNCRCPRCPYFGENTRATVGVPSVVILAASMRATAGVKVAAIGAESTQVIAAAHNAAISAEQVASFICNQIRTR